MSKLVGFAGLPDHLHPSTLTKIENGIAAVGGDIVEVQPTPELRWYRELPQMPPQLQQKWLAKTTRDGVTSAAWEWRDVPSIHGQSTEGK